MECTRTCEQYLDLYSTKAYTMKQEWNIKVHNFLQVFSNEIRKFSYSAIDEYVFLNRKDAVDAATNAEENNKKVISTETYYEEY